jgi:DNA-directed RNA polymerase I, II, and III subunit RPABC5
MVIADKYRYYLKEVRKRKLAGGKKLDEVVYLTQLNNQKTAEGEVLDELKITKMCCRRHFLTHVDFL